jgi:hypothetical protein
VKVLYGALAFLAAGLLALAVWEFGVKGSIEQSVRAEMQARANDVAVAQAESAVVRIDTVYRERVREYPVFRDRIVAANPDNAPLQEFAKRCDQLVLTCEDRVAAGDRFADSLRKQVKDLKTQKRAPDPRFSAFLLGGYDYLRGKPLAQAGGDARIAGPLSLTAYVEAAKGDSLERVRTRGVVALKFTFR